MTIQITCINKANGDHENPYVAISHLGWKNPSNQTTGKSTREEIYDWLKDGNSAYVEDNQGHRAYLITAISTNRTKYVKTEADETKSDNLLKLPECKSSN